MKYQPTRLLAQVTRAVTAVVFVAILSGCFGGSNKPQPAELQAVTALVSARQSWNTRVGQVNYPLEVSVSGNSVAGASDRGTPPPPGGPNCPDLLRVGLH